MASEPLIVSFGGGVNSAAMLVGMRERRIVPDAILFADTGGEKPETYAFVDLMNSVYLSEDWHCQFPQITTVRNDGMYSSLEAEMLQTRTLPPIVFGKRSCSDKYKVRPQKKYAKSVYGDVPIRWAVGIDAGESHRAEGFENSWFPLIEWRWSRNLCIQALERAGLPIPVKSACFFCPSSKKREIRRLGSDHPELLQRAIEMERNASKAHTVIGLGRSWPWEDLIRAEESQFDMFAESPEIPCVCFDGEED